MTIKAVEILLSATLLLNIAFAIILVKYIKEVNKFFKRSLKIKFKL